MKLAKSREQVPLWNTGLSGHYHGTTRPLNTFLLRKKSLCIINIPNILKLSESPRHQNIYKV